MSNSHGYKLETELITSNPIKDWDHTNHGALVSRELRLAAFGKFVMGYILNTDPGPNASEVSQMRTTWQMFGLIDPTCECITGVFISRQDGENGLWLAKSSESDPGKFSVTFRLANGEYYVTANSNSDV